MSQGINAVRASIAALFCLSTPALAASAAASPAEAVTETIQGEQLIIESTTTPELFTALAPGDVFEWDVSVSTRDPAEIIEAELHLEGDMPVEATVLSCKEPWSQPPNSGSQSVGCEGPAEVHQQALHEDSASESFQVPQGYNLRLILQTGSFDAEAGGRISLRVTAEGEHLEASPPSEDPPPQPSEGVSPTEKHPEADAPSGADGSSAAHPEEAMSGAAQETEMPSSDTQQPPQAEQRGGLPATGASLALVLFGALFLLGVGTYLRRRRRPSHP